LKCSIIGHHFGIMKEEKKIVMCAWIGDGELCHQPAMPGKSYCAKHQDRMYMTLPMEMADYIIDKETKDTD